MADGVDFGDILLSVFGCNDMKSLSTSIEHDLQKEIKKLAIDIS